MKISPALCRELADNSKLIALKRDIDIIGIGRHNPFIENRRVNVEAFLEFVTQYNEFINHQPRPFCPIKDREMKL